MNVSNKGSVPFSSTTKAKLDAMFGSGTDTKADTARAKLDELLGGKDKSGK